VKVVIKKDGRRQRFSPTKLKRSIDRAAKDAGVSAKKRKETIFDVYSGIIESFGKRGSVRTRDLRKSVLGRLDAKIYIRNFG
jgi:transcriptional repressor NrdR